MDADDDDDDDDDDGSSDNDDRGLPVEAMKPMTAGLVVAADKDASDNAAAAAARDDDDDDDDDDRNARPRMLPLPLEIFISLSSCRSYKSCTQYLWCIDGKERNKCMREIEKYHWMTDDFVSHLTLHSCPPLTLHREAPGCNDRRGSGL